MSVSRHPRSGRPQPSGPPQADCVEAGEGMNQRGPAAIGTRLLGLTQRLRPIMALPVLATASPEPMQAVTSAPGALTGTRRAGIAEASTAPPLRTGASAPHLADPPSA